MQIKSVINTNWASQILKNKHFKDIEYFINAEFLKVTTRHIIEIKCTRVKT